MVHKRQRGARKRIHNKAGITSTFIVLHLADMLVKHGQANPYTWISNQEDDKIWVFLCFGIGLFLYTRKVFASKWATGGFCNGNSQSAWTLRGTKSDSK